MSVTQQPARTRPGATTIAAVVLLVLQALVSSAGFVYFGLFADGGTTGGIVFAAVGVALHATGLATLPGLLRGARTPWLLAIGYAWSYAFWSIYKVFAEGETESVGFLVVALLLLALLVAPATRRRIDS